MESITGTENKLLKNIFGQELFIPMDQPETEFVLRGKFEKKILFITNDEGLPSFPAEIETMFQRMLSKLNSNENEIGIIAFNNNDFNFSQLKRKLQPKAIVAFGISANELGLNIEAKKFSVINLNDFVFMESDSFAVLYKSDAKKKEVFPALLKLFSL